MKKVFLVFAVAALFVACNDAAVSTPEAPKTDAPAVETPKADSPAVVAPKVDSPAVVAPKADTPAVKK